MLKVHFVHVGYHKTATTWFQLYGLKAHPGIVMVNDSTTDRDPLFIDNFVQPRELDFSPARFEQIFVQKFLREHSVNGDKIYGICEENLSGHYWNGAGETVLADRLKAVFGPVKIIVTIRQQTDMLRSLYSNYVKNGGTKSLPGLLADTEFWGHQVYAKLCYDKLVEYYIRLFSRENVLVLPYENLRDDPQDAMNRYFTFIGAPPIVFSEALLNKKVNPGLSSLSESAMRWVNRLGGEQKLLKKAIRGTDRYLFAKIFSPDSAKLEKYLDPIKTALWKESNRLLQARLGLPLDRYGYSL